MEKVTVLCMKWGTAYGPEYVNRLYNMVCRYLRRPFDFVCLTDNNVGICDGVITRPIPSIFVPPENECSPWKKLVLYKENLEGITGKVLFLDLDVVIVDDIDCFFEYSPKFTIIENWTQKGRGIGNSSVFCFTVGQHPEVFEEFQQAPYEIVKKFDNEQIYLSHRIGSRKEYFPDAWCKSFKRHCVYKDFRRLFQEARLPEGVKIVVFHGNPKPEHAIQGRWPGRLIPYMKKVSWVETHWK